MGRPLLVSIVGPTAVGKTALSIDLAKHFNTEIISADSRQMYQEIGIGTAKPSIEEQAGVVHHFVDNLKLEDECSAGKFADEALELIEKNLSEKEVIILAGGSGLYVKALLEGLDDVPKDLTIRAELNEEFNASGLQALLEELKKLDAISFNKIDQQNPQRVIRALEVCRASGKPFSSFHTQAPVSRPFDMLTIGLEMERPLLNDRIAQRFSVMMDQGWLEEARSVYDKRHFNSLNTVGYKELFSFMEGTLTMEETRVEIIKETQRFAKRQMTWFKRMQQINWIQLPKDNAKDEVIHQVNSLVHR